MTLQQIAVNEAACRYMREHMAMPDYATDQEQNWILGHLATFGQLLLAGSAGIASSSSPQKKEEFLRASAPSDGAERQDLRASNETAPSVRRFSRVGGFEDTTAFIEHAPDGVFTVLKTGQRKQAASCYTLRYCRQSVKEGRWYELPVGEVPDTKGFER